MEEVASTAKLVDPGAVNAQSGLTATLPRSDIEAALQDDAGADLFLEIARIQNGERDDRTVKVAWERSDLQELLKSSGDPITFSFDRVELERMLDEPDVEAQGLREKALVLTVAAATAAGIAGSAAGQVLNDGSTSATPAAAVSGLATDTATSGVPGAVSSFATDASTAGPGAAIGDPSSVPADGWTSAVESPVPEGGITMATDTTSGGQPGAVSGFATDASTSGQPDAVTGITSDIGSERTRAPETPSIGGGGGFSLPDAAVEAALAGGLALLITGAAFVSRTQRRRESPA